MKFFSFPQLGVREENLKRSSKGNNINIACLFHYELICLLCIIQTLLIIIWVSLRYMRLHDKGQQVKPVSSCLGLEISQYHISRYHITLPRQIP